MAVNWDALGTPIAESDFQSFHLDKAVQMPKIRTTDLTQAELELIIRSRVETDDPYSLTDIDEAGRRRQPTKMDRKKATDE